MDILFNKQGTPLLLSSSKIFGESVGKPADYDIRKRDIIAPFESYGLSYTIWQDYKVVNWGKHNNRFPQEAAKVIGGTSVLNTGLRFLQNLTLGQGLFPCRVEGYEANGNEILSPVEDPALNRILNSRLIRRYLERASRDYFKYGLSAVQLIPDVTGSQIAGLNPINPLYFRLTQPDQFGRMKCIVSGCWPQLPESTPDDHADILDTLAEYDTELQFQQLIEQHALTSPKVMLVRDSWSNDEIYGEPVWLSAYILGWIDIARLVPKFLKKAYKNQITWKWHVQIPYSYWDKKFPRTAYKDINARKQAINKEMDIIEDNLCGTDNAEKPLFTNYCVNEASGKVEEEWKITALDNKYKGGDNLVTSAAANSEILFTLGVNPNVLGAGMPGGTYALQSGGSNIREAYLVNIANAWIHRQNFLDPIYLMLRSQGYNDIQIRYRNTILTTLDTGAGTARTLS